jgi:hypothetical protein
MPKNARTIDEDEYGFSVPAAVSAEAAPFHQPVELPVVVASPASALVVAAEPEEVLPRDLKSAFALLTAASSAVCDQERDADGYPRLVSTVEKAKRQKRFERIRAHVRQLQQGPAPVVMTSDDLRKHRQSHEQISERAARIAELAR